jgi:hypothetical protein
MHSSGTCEKSMRVSCRGVNLRLLAREFLKTKSRERVPGGVGGVVAEPLIGTRTCLTCVAA